MQNPRTTEPQNRPLLERMKPLASLMLGQLCYRSKPTEAQQCIEVRVQVPVTVAARLYPGRSGCWERAPARVVLEVTVESDFQVLRVPVELATPRVSTLEGQRPSSPRGVCAAEGAA